MMQVSYQRTQASACPFETTPPPLDTSTRKFERMRPCPRPLWAVVLFVFNPIELASCEGPVADKGYLDDEWRRAGARASRRTAPAVGQQASHSLTRACVRATASPDR